ncbi:SUMF1/EgtB/PvdO family nonheme iron enzyme [Nostoc sp. ChiSLP03a]|uniref:SUMF1/EgtB/PvdO family nonheme iron enzyme n=1 Tax=Nostoc sp. ChiSLP03a TaxID=3075380 RepID=UPI002AD22613|nr:SUMF1/EgtB/PvdO family nonheme iron enzyme [Nostoc sp. ChiSLP03a]MDZ8212334.1 SUMF1/EgtB/PvdO family nonheme iron enzyme [Nostoc sp. ChiSLP03a]
MAGNVWEWCSDWYRADAHQSVRNCCPNPTGPTKSFDLYDPYTLKRVVKGGSFLCILIAIVTDLVPAVALLQIQEHLILASVVLCPHKRGRKHGIIADSCHQYRYSDLRRG